MVTWFFENNHFANAWIPFDRLNQKKLEYVYRHHEEILKCMKDDRETEVTEQQQQQQPQQPQQQQQQQQQQDKTTTNNTKTNGTTSLSKVSSTIDAAQTATEKSNFTDRNTKKVAASTIPPISCIIKEIDSDEEDGSVHSSIQYSHNCLYIKLVDSHFEQPITLYPALLLGSLPDRDFLIIRAEMTDHERSQSERYFFFNDV